MLETDQIMVWNHPSARLTDGCAVPERSDIDTYHANVHVHRLAASKAAIAVAKPIEYKSSRRESFARSTNPLPMEYSHAVPHSQMASMTASHAAIYPMMVFDGCCLGSGAAAYGTTRRGRCCRAETLLRGIWRRVVGNYGLKFRVQASAGSLFPINSCAENASQLEREEEFLTPRN